MQTPNRPWMSLAVALAAIAALSCNGGGGGGGPTCDLAGGAAAGGYQIELQFRTSVTAEQQTAFQDAAARLEKIVTGQLSTVAVNKSCNTGSGLVPVNQTIGGLLILVSVQDLGSTGILAQSGPCLIRSESHLPVVGTMTFNSRYLATLSTDELHRTVLHEMLHVLGFGTMWGPTTTDGYGFDLLANAGKVGAGYTGFQALCGAKGQNSAPGTWTSVPVEDCVSHPTATCGSGTQDSHWRWAVFADELMTGWITAGPQPLSATTIASLHDLGYQVDLTQADAYAIPTAAAAHALEGAPAPIPLGDDLLHVQPVEVDEGVAP